MPWVNPRMIACRMVNADPSLERPAILASDRVRAG
jgi:hypothetical protein